MKPSYLLSGIIIAGSLTLGMVGCETTQTAIPTSAQMVGEGTGQVAYRTPTGGQIYVYDQTWNQMVYSGKVDGNRLVQVDPATGKTTIDSQVVAEKSLGNGDQFKIYFEPADRTSQTTTIEKQTVIEHQAAD